MGQDSWNLQYGRQKPAKYRRGTSVDMHPDEGRGPSRTKVLKANGNPKTYGSKTDQKSVKHAHESGIMKPTAPKRRK